MHYVDGFVAAVPTLNKAKYIEHATMSAAVFKENGALKIVETWEDNVPEGEITSFPLSVKRQPNESIVFSWVIWPSKAVRDLAWKAMMDDSRMQPENNPMPFDGKRLIYGGFNTIIDE